MSCYICTSPRTYNAIIDVLAEEDTLNILNADEGIKRLFALNVRSYCERYNIEEGTEEYKKDIPDFPGIKYETLGDQYTLAEKLKAVDCWLYQSCEGTCDQDPDFIVVQKACDHVYQLVAAKKTGRNPNEISPDEARRIVRPMQEKHNLWE